MGTRAPRIGGRTLPDGSPPPIRPRPPRYDRRINKTSPGDHALESVDVLWIGGGDERSGQVEIRFDARDFSGAAMSLEADPVNGEIVAVITPNTTPWVDDGVS